MVGPAPGPGEPPGAHIPGQGQQGERGQHVQRVPLGADGQPEAQAGRDPPGPDDQGRSETALQIGDPGSLQVVGQPVAEPVPVGGQAADRRQQEEGEEDVEQGDPRHHEGQAVEGQQQPGQAADQGRPGHPADQPDGDQDQQRAEDQRREPPAERVHPEQLLATGDQPLAHRRVHDERGSVLHGVEVARDDLGVGVRLPAPLVSVLQQGIRVLGVVGLVEDQLVGIAQIDDPDDERHGGDRHGDHPAGDLVGRHRQPEPIDGAQGSLRRPRRGRRGSAGSGTVESASSANPGSTSRTGRVTGPS